jgi:hypothetical protein
VAGDEGREDDVVDDGVGAVEEGGEGRLHAAGAVPPAIGVAGEGAVDERGERLGDLRGALEERGERAGPDLLEGDEAVAVAEHELVGEELVEDDAERVDVGALIEGAAEGLLGRHVRDLALDGHVGVDGGRGSGAVDVAGAGGGAGDAEVEDLHGAREAQHDVVRADVAVDDAEGRPRSSRRAWA